MMKSSVFAACVLGSMLWTANIATADDSKPASKPAQSAASRTCLQETGTLIKHKPNECSISPGRVYGKEDMDRTGKTTISGVLRTLDPSVTIR
jgi:hypothetical protein